MSPLFELERKDIEQITTADRERIVNLIAELGRHEAHAEYLSAVADAIEHAGDDSQAIVAASEEAWVLAAEAAAELEGFVFEVVFESRPIGGGAASEDLEPDDHGFGFSRWEVMVNLAKQVYGPDAERGYYHPSDLPDWQEHKAIDPRWLASVRDIADVLIDHKGRTWRRVEMAADDPRLPKTAGVNGHFDHYGSPVKQYGDVWQRGQEFVSAVDLAQMRVSPGLSPRQIINERVRWAVCDGLRYDADSPDGSFVVGRMAPEQVSNLDADECYRILLTVFREASEDLARAQARYARRAA